MSIHHGARLKKIIEKSGKSISYISNMSGVVRASIYNYFDYEDLPRKKVRPILEVLKIDIDDFFNSSNSLGEDQPAYTLKERLKDLEAQIALLKEQVESKNEIIALLKSKKTDRLISK